MILFLCPHSRTERKEEIKEKKLAQFASMPVRWWREENSRIFKSNQNEKRLYQTKTTSDDEIGASRPLPTFSSSRDPPITPTPIPMAHSSGGRGGSQEMAEMDGHGGAETKASDDVEMEEGKDGGTVAGSATFVVRELGKSFSQPFLGGKETFLITKVMPCVCCVTRTRTVARVSQ
jgi:hypothetical protein